MPAPRLASRAIVEAAMTEAEWDRVVVDYAKVRGWLTYHTHRSDRSEAGFPDRVFLRGPRLVVAELKREKDRTTARRRAAQQAWLDAFAAVPGAEAYLWRPSDWSTVQAVLA